MRIVHNPARRAMVKARSFKRAPNMSSVLPPHELVNAVLSIGDEGERRKLWQRAWEKAQGDADKAIVVMGMSVDVLAYRKTPRPPAAVRSASSAHLQHLRSATDWDALCARDPSMADRIASRVIAAVRDGKAARGHAA